MRNVTSTQVAPSQVRLDNLAVLDDVLECRLVQRIMKDEELSFDLSRRILDQTGRLPQAGCFAAEHAIQPISPGGHRLAYVYPLHEGVRQVLSRADRRTVYPSRAYRRPRSSRRRPGSLQESCCHARSRHHRRRSTVGLPMQG